MRKQVPIVQYNGASADQILKDIEIEVRRLIIEYQRQTLAPPPWDMPPQPAAEILPDQPVEQAQAMPVESVNSHNKKKKNIADLIGETAAALPGQITIEEAIAEAAQQAQPAPPQSEDQPAEAEAQPAPQQPVRELTWLQEFRLRKYEDKQERKRPKRYYKSLAFQVKCNIEPLEDLLDFIHMKRSEQ